MAVMQGVKFCSIETEDQKKTDFVPPTSLATHARKIGIINPPPGIRNIVDTTSQFVAKNGPEFEKMIIASHAASNAKFNFLNASHPYNAYYQHRLSEFPAQNQNQPSSDPADPAFPESIRSSAPVTDGDETIMKPLVRKILDPPEAEQYTVKLPEGITREELDIIKLTAQFVAQNGNSFLTGLTSNNPQFLFLKPTHSMFMFFTSLADAYSKVLMPPKGLTEKLKKSVTDMTTVLERCLHRLEWERSHEQARQKVEDEIEQERLQMARIDWLDYVVVETIDFADDEEELLPAPMTIEEVIRRSKVSDMAEEEEDIVEPGKVVEMEIDEEEVKLVEKGTRAAEEEKNEMKTAPLEEQEQSMRIVKNWKRPLRISPERDSTKNVVSPITGEVIPISEMSEHMRISLIDPKYKEQKERMFAKIRETTLAQDDEISKNIMGLALRRPDIFGTTEEEVSNAVKAEIEKKNPEQVIWDGHIGRTATQAMSQNPIGEDQNDPANRAPPPLRPGLPSIRPIPPPVGLASNLPRVPPRPRPPPVNMMPSVRPPPPPPMQLIPGQQQFLVNRPPPMPPSISVNPPRIPVSPPPVSQFTPMSAPRPYVPLPVLQPGMHMVPPPPLPRGMPPPLPEEEPEPKRQRLDDSVLIPEDQFLAQHPGPVCVTVSVPNVDEGNLKGQILEITVQSLHETVGSLKVKIAGEIQFPSNKQKLSGKVGFLKDNLSLAYYNVAGGETLALSLRERGGRKR
ncbi:hypothetical protein Vadar_016583 [Vaccinium darrowii]|uniref:Uncharacterized protein n=1 Tax=Vaccinium darrowii TaxID=229202 RepID=A0ACB7Y773_9ERIC|nr:hypothetical protein Vadar_016583 [Vaccinium darrowii]